ncbi:LysR family transcriptional regulator [Pseudomonas monteilii]|uniref:LysR family transcriptional regulator n=1 Tax=Pseudomonas monteilii TaxID=76759 RepID=UPI003D025CD0
MDKLRSLEVFIAAVEAGSFSEAARRLDMSSVMVGRHVEQLEHHLKARLLERTTRRQTLTDAGKRFYVHAKAVAEEFARAEASVAHLVTSASGCLKISAATTLGECIISPLAADFQAAHPNVQLELELTNRPVRLIDEGLDILIRVGEFDRSAYLNTIEIGDYHMVACAAPSYLNKHGTPLSPRELTHHNCLGNMIWNKSNVWQFIHDNEHIPWPVSTGFLCNSGHALRQAAIRGRGLLLQTYSLVKNDIEAGLLIPILKDHSPSSRPVYLQWRADKKPLPKVTIFVEYMKDHARDLLCEPQYSNES